VSQPIVCILAAPLGELTRLLTAFMTAIEFADRVSVNELFRFSPPPGGWESRLSTTDISLLIPMVEGSFPLPSVCGLRYSDRCRAVHCHRLTRCTGRA